MHTTVQPPFPSPFDISYIITTGYEVCSEETTSTVSCLHTLTEASLKFEVRGCSSLKVAHVVTTNACISSSSALLWLGAVLVLSWQLG